MVNSQYKPNYPGAAFVKPYNNKILDVENLCLNRSKHNKYLCKVTYI